MRAPIRYSKKVSEAYGKCKEENREFFGRLPAGRASRLLLLDQLPCRLIGSNPWSSEGRASGSSAGVPPDLDQVRDWSHDEERVVRSVNHLAEAEDRLHDRHQD